MLGDSHPWHTYIYGPFDFATIRSRKTCNCIGINQTSWDAFAAKSMMFSNLIPWFDLPTYSIHVDPGVHLIFPRMIAAAINDLQPPLTKL
jgi:hypothetical protein